MANEKEAKAAEGMVKRDATSFPAPLQTQREPEDPQVQHTASAEKTPLKLTSQKVVFTPIVSTPPAPIKTPPVSITASQALRVAENSSVPPLSLPGWL